MEAKCSAPPLPAAAPGTPIGAARGVDALFHLTVRRADGSLIQESGWFFDEASAHAAAEDLATSIDDVVRVRPEVETSRIHGRARYPLALHLDASEDAWIGWFAARTWAERDALDRQALRRQAQPNQWDVATLACMRGAA